MSKKMNFKVLLKAVVIGVLLLLMLIPLAFVKSLMSERSNYKQEALRTISSSWGADQLVAAPFVNVPYSYNVLSEDKNGKKITNTVEGVYKFSPRDLNANVEMTPQIRYIGIFEMPVYTADFAVRGNFTPQDAPANIGLRYGSAFLTIELTDLKGIAKMPEGNFNGAALDFAPYAGNATVGYSGTLGRDEDYKSNVDLPQVKKMDSYYSEDYAVRAYSSSNSIKAISAPVDFRNKSGNFEIKFSLRGSGSLNFVPTARQNKFSVKSSWPDPLFFNSFLPSAKEISSKGFKADWDISYLASGVPQSFEKLDVTQSVFGVKLSTPVDNYRNGLRAAKYGILFLALTFLACFVFEIAGKNPIHPFQYILVGLAMAVFYLLLISLSEFISFGLAYFIAAAAVVIMISCYIRYGIIKQPGAKYLLAPAAAFTVLYVYLYVLLQLQDFSFLFGALGLFAGLGAVMYATRNINWYEE
ncbi:MAG: cell envelope integrity protein CreD [Elusimicrobium sp.]|jgi:inner membrane protein|nr:cell envelope integrity protein CreD [Elusimicrobium sp.]